MSVKVIRSDLSDVSLQQIREDASRCVADGVKGVRVYALDYSNGIAVDVYSYRSESGDPDEFQEAWVEAQDDFDELFLREFLEEGY